MNLPSSLDLLADGFAVGDLRAADVGLHVELALHAVDDDVQMELAHARDDGLAGFFVGLDAEGLVFFGQAAHGMAHLLLVGFGLRLDGDGDDGLGEGDLLEDDRLLRVAHRVRRRWPFFMATVAPMSPA